ncbi:polysaccharide deacetylase family protein [Hoeflea sp. TYP-13]|uniref:polysaccharide deacetylase family protein n=1 Tax=Hoeflea sp. TYP-13 TaxID=3230023 RepID=UPI0034C5EAAC
MPTRSKLAQYRTMARRAAKWLAIRGGLEAVALAAGIGLVRCPKSKGVIFTLHQVRPAGNSSFAPNTHLAVTPEFLDNTIKMLLSQGWKPARLDDMPRLLEETGPEERFMAFTLDDGYRDNLEYAHPVFKKHKIPYTVFVASGFADRSRSMWWITLEEMLARRDEITLRMCEGERTFSTRSTMEKYAAYDYISDRFDTKDEDVFVAGVDDAARRAGIEPLEIVDREILDEGGLREFSADPLVRLGAHSVSHINLARADHARMKSEISVSTDHIATLTGSQPSSFAYPYGNRNAACEREFEAAADQGFRVAVTTRPGLLEEESAKKPMALPRVSLNGYHQKTRYVKALLTGIPFNWASYSPAGQRPD